MLLWEDIQRAQTEFEKERNNPKVIECPKCGSTFFTLEEYKQYRRDMFVGLSQKPPTSPNTRTYYFYKCICGEVLEPPISTNMSPLSDDYNKFVAKVKSVLDDKTEK
jgi:DNA-directed RNA polymerase subunit RPC12/RpoP